MLPFLDPKKAVGVIVARRNKGHLNDAKPEVDAPGVESNHELEMACEGILKAIDERSVKGLAKAIEEAFESVGHHDDGDEDEQE